MKIKKNFFVILIVLVFFVGCGGQSQPQQNSQNTKQLSPTKAAKTVSGNKATNSTSANVDVSKDKGIGPIQEIKLTPINQALVTKGEKIFNSKCFSCHRIDKKFVGPSLGEVTKRRTPEFIMNMILNPVEMTKKDPIAKELLAQYLTQMTFQNITQDDARAILEYFRHIYGNLKTKK